MIFDDATRAQITAARPTVSTWLAANAGSGKTRVLTDRVARLLLEEVEPQRILCLTYTKAAASEMQNRLFKRLGAWAMLEDEALRQEMVELGIEGTLDAQRLRKARTLFALAIETPGGLKIQTIHSFCAALLRRFPLEAEVSPQFTEIEDRAADLLRADILDEMSEGADAECVSNLADFYTGEDFPKLTKHIVGQREAFADPLTWGDAMDLFGQPADLTVEGLEASVFLGSERELIAGILPHLVAKGGVDEKAARTLKTVTAWDITALPTLEQVFLTGSGAAEPFTAKIGKFPTKPTQQKITDSMPALDDLMRRVEGAREARLALAAAQKTLALHDFARTFLNRYATAKQQRGWLDFDDLILKARALLRDKAVAAWVLYRIDGGIDHILVDEAQDTSPRQWDVIEALTDEFYSGEGARSDVDRTLFVVGDKKQSIYSFQGADPREFDRKSTLFDEKITTAGQRFEHHSLDYSFRSSPAILRLVDTVFDPRRRENFGAESMHIAFKDALPGRVDLWPLIEQTKDNDDQPWTDPLDRLSDTHEDVQLANKIAQEIKALTDPTAPSYLPEDSGTSGTFVKRPIRAGDFLILVQRRGKLFSEIIRACKAADLPIAGADRLKVGAELAVRDLAALLSFLATADDSLSLATALRSPLFGWSEQQLYTLAHGRTETHLWQALRNAGDQAETLSILHDMRDQVDFLRPYDLIERILTRHDGRKRLLARLGPEAEDGINAMLTQALAYERTAVPSLTGFIEWMQTDDLEIKRQIDSASNQIRVMTVHGAKGLEAPIVILPDTAKREIRITDQVISTEDRPVWKPGSAELPHTLRTTLDQMKEAQQAERMRLLYVALTRAEKWLIVAAAGKLSSDNTDWYQITAEAMDHLNATPIDKAGTRRFEIGDWDGLQAVEMAKTMDQTVALEPVFTEIAAETQVPDTVLSPSDLDGAKALPGERGEDTETAMAFGSYVHALLEGRRPDTETSLPSESIALAEEEAAAVLNAPGFSHLFEPGSLMEVPVTAEVGGVRLHGVIDRLILSEGRVLIVDYKTNRHIPATPDVCPEGILAQMGAYALMLADIYPHHVIETAILWTAAPELMYLPHETVTSAFWRSPRLDAGTAHS